MSVTIGSATYETYATVEEADAYLAADFTATAWRDETDEDAKARALVTATRLLDRQVWPGQKTDEDQDQAWPRTGVSGVDEDDIPQAVIDACCLLAKYIHEGSTLETSTTTANNTKRLKAGSAEIEYFFPLTNGTRLPLPVMELLAGLLGTAGSAITAAQSFGTDGCSVADDSYRPASGF
jgi:hypothetical protein